MKKYTRVTLTSDSHTPGIVMREWTEKTSIILWKNGIRQVVDNNRLRELNPK